MGATRRAGFDTVFAQLEGPLLARHQRYHQVVGALYREVCRTAGGLALQLHAYSPRSVGIERVDHGIVQALHAAYQPEAYATWPERSPIAKSVLFRAVVDVVAAP